MSGSATRGPGAPQRRGIAMNDIWAVLLALAVWFVLARYVLPRAGVPT